jgi:uncharacterized membrane protein
MSVDFRENPAAAQPLSPSVLSVLRLVLLLALGIDSYLAWVSLSGGAVAGCGPASACHTVLSTRWAYWLGIPVSIPALLVYSCMLAASFWLSPHRSAYEQLRAWQVLVPGAVAIAGAGLWFIALQVFVIKAICPFCMTAHGCALLAAGLLLSHLPSHAARQHVGASEELRPSNREQRRNLPRQNKSAGAARKETSPPTPALNGPSLLSRARVFQLSLGALAGVALLIVGQLLHQPKQYQTVAVAAGIKTNAPAPSVRLFQVFDGEFELNLDEVPLVGRPDAPRVMVSLFDYTCHFCRELHGPLRKPPGSSAMTWPS